MTEQVPPPEPGDVPGLPALADALPAAEHHCRRAVAHLEGRTARGDLLEALVVLLEAAGGPDVGNVVRTHLERTGRAVVPPYATDRARERVLLAALHLHGAAEVDLQDRLRAAGLVSDGPAADRTSGRAVRARHTQRVVAERRSAVHRVLSALGGPDLQTFEIRSWTEALVEALPPELSQGETDRGAAPR